MPHDPAHIMSRLFITTEFVNLTNLEVSMAGMFVQIVVSSHTGTLY